MIKDVKKYSLDYKIDDFMIWCQQKELRIKTITSYESCLRLFARYMKDQHNIDNINEIKEQHIREYIKYTKDRGKYTFVSDKNSLRINYPENRKDYNSKISVTTINNYIRNLKVFLNYMESEYNLKNNPMKKIKQFKNSRKPKEAITDLELKRLLQNIDTTKFHEYRDYIIIQLLIDTGMRLLNECLLLEIENIDIDRDAILIPQDITKGRKDRYVFFSRSMRTQLKRWIQYKDRYVESDLLFCTNLAQKLSRGIRTIQRYLKELVQAKMIKIKRRGSISNVYTIINKVASTVEKAVKKAKNAYDNHFKKKKDNDDIKKTKFNDYEQRSYNYNNLEKILLGNMEYEPDKLLE